MRFMLEVMRISCISCRSFAVLFFRASYQGGDTEVQYAQPGVTDLNGFQYIQSQRFEQT